MSGELDSPFLNLKLKAQSRNLFQAVGIPLPSIRWYRGHSEIMGSKNVAVINEGSEIRISHVKSSDLGSYMCVAKNTEGNITHITKLVQAGSLKINPINVFSLAES